VLQHLKPPLRILDIGCGTGLVGVAFKDLTQGGRLDGIDIAPRMIEAARARGIYNDLIVGDLETVLAAPGVSYDLIVSADTMTYFGELAPAFSGVANRLEPGGFYLFASEAKTGNGWEKTKVHRYRHSEAYLREAAGRAGLEFVHLAHCTLRREENEPVQGFAVALRKSAR
jgi:predicted TPR repeat methyltransferase